MAIVIGLSAFGLMMAALFTAGFLDWGGARARNEPNKYCEGLGTGRMIKQPVNTWSNLGYVIAGLGILLFLTLRGPGADPNPMSRSNGLSILYGCLVIWLGPGSMFLHASQKVWGGWLDNLSMNMFVAFLPCYAVARVVAPQNWQKGLPLFLVLYLVITIALALLTWFIEWESFGILTFAILIGLAVGGEVLVGASSHVSRDIGWLIAGSVSFGAAFLFWFPSRTGGPWCRPDSLWQGHAAWHLLGAVAAVFIFVYLASETVT